MQFKQPETIGAVIDEFLKRIGANDKLLQIKVGTIWGQYWGNLIDGQTEYFVVKNQILFVKFKSPVVKNEVFMRRSQCLNFINKQLGYNGIKQIIVN